MPSPRCLSLTSRPSASEASHSRVANVSLPVRCSASLPSAPRTASVRPSAAIRTSGTGTRAAKTIAAKTKIAPLQRSGVFRSAMRRRPAVASKSGAVPNEVTCPTAPGRLATHRATVSIQAMPYPICRQNRASKPNGMAITPRMPIVGVRLKGCEPVSLSRENQRFPQRVFLSDTIAY
jgi:hypothetical protein